ncbi:hypothetical protein N7523_008208 [Penicillium sp. IBT 18751x]|nr:hypothetical protein N7523_008208 [Penicillium sp. IBT 18751x]
MFSPSKRAPMSPRNAVALKGLFQDGIWMCNCRERLPAVKRETKKAGKNQGRYFWTCQNPPGKQCGFFLWADEAEVREKEAILANSRSELDNRDASYRTPSKQTYRAGNGLLTPQTEHRVIGVPPRQFKSPPQSAKARMMTEDTDEFGWHDDSEENEELSEVLNSTQQIISQPNFNPETPQKATRTSSTTSPGKRKLFDSSHDESSGTLSPLATPSTSRSGRHLPSSAEISMTPAPTKYRDVLSTDSKSGMSNLAQQVTAVLDKHDVVLPNEARDELLKLLNTHDLKLIGAIRGRDAVRTVLEKERAHHKEENLRLSQENVKLKEQNLSLEAHNAMHLSVIDSFKE